MIGNIKTEPLTAARVVWLLLAGCIIAAGVMTGHLLGEALINSVRPAEIYYIEICTPAVTEVLEV